MDGSQLMATWIKLIEMIGAEQTSLKRASQIQKDE
jgi:hypothetical protein